MEISCGETWCCSLTFASWFAPCSSFVFWRASLPRALMILYAFSWPTVGSMCLQELLERSWDKAILPSPDLLPAFWELQKKHPAYTCELLMVQNYCCLKNLCFFGLHHASPKGKSNIFGKKRLFFERAIISALSRNGGNCAQRIFQVLATLSARGRMPSSIASLCFSMVTAHQSQA